MVIPASVSYIPGPKGRAATTYVPEFNKLYYRVLADDGKRLKVHQDEEERWFEKTRFVLLDKAVEYFTAQINQYPAEAGVNFRAPSWMYERRAMALLLTGKMDEAIADYSELLRLAEQPREPTEVDLRNIQLKFANAGVPVFARDEKLREIYRNERKLEVAKSCASIRLKRGYALSVKGEFVKARQDYEEAIRLAPEIEPQVRQLLAKFPQPADKEN